MSTAPARPVFLLGCPRSGTTLLQLMLHAHPRIALPPENRFVLPAYERRLSFGDLRRCAGRAALAEWITTRRETRFDELGLDADTVAARITDGPPTLGSALGVPLRAYAERHGKARWGDKRPAYALHVPEILRLFPDAQFVHLVRDGRDCVASLLGMPWWHAGLHEAVATWAQVMDTTRRHARRLGPERWHELRYEDLLTGPEPVLRGLCAYLGEEYDPAMTAPHRLAGLAVPARKTWHRHTRSAPDAARAGTWRRRLTPDQIGLCEAAFGDRLLHAGYEPSGAIRPDPAELLRYRRVSALRRAAHARRRLRDRRTRLREPGPVAALPAGI
ncbi:sulfotransferase family protein [Streptomyces daghestanicus]|uniref:Sulfotransferase n=1 Tax=Streptomyces daghestanicus TaxID=66885 RepID=A0ABQ3PTL1_9ACTN|nr:sulfotransferase [Streptomyces daghestanicus]GGU53506.1 sulfotransferase [Streptomyces daghestanicus]GHI28359.1 sulfotransferase [Streptomyces daghestanicus]